MPGEGNGNPLQYSCLENPMDRRAQQAIVKWGCKELDTTERSHTHTHTHTHTRGSHSKQSSFYPRMQQLLQVFNDTLRNSPLLICSVKSASQSSPLYGQLGSRGSPLSSRWSPTHAPLCLASLQPSQNYSLPSQTTTPGFRQRWAGPGLDTWQTFQHACWVN